MKEISGGREKKKSEILTGPPEGPGESPGLLASPNDRAV